MNLANPSALLWAALAIPIVIFYISEDPIAADSRVDRHLLAADLR